MALFQLQPKRSVPEPVKPPQHGTANPLTAQSSELNAFRNRVLSITATVLAVGVLAYAVYGPWFAVRLVRVSGTREINPVSVKAVTEEYLRAWRFGLIPNDNLWLVSRRNLSQALEKKIRQRISVEQVQVIKRNRHDLEIVVIERTPVAVWKAGTEQGTIDKMGTVINLVTETAGLPEIVDQGEKKFTVGEQVLTGPAMAGWKTLNDAFNVSTLTVEQYFIPVPTCPTTIITPEEQAEANTNSQNPPISGLNVNTAEPTNLNTNSSTNENTNGGNTNTIQPIVVQTDCDVAALAKASQEIHAKLKDGPLVLFDRHQDLALAVQTVKRLLTDPDNNGATYIDIRFQERVYIK